MYFLKPIADEVRSFQITFHNYKKAMKLVLAAIFACLAAVLQSFGGFLPGIGFLISPLATAPILLCSMLSYTFGIMSYFLTIMLLFILEPTELIIFPFTTGLLGFGIGASFHFFRKRISIIVAGSVLLTLGIAGLLYIFQFPILGQIASDAFSFPAAGSILFFSMLYSWLWVEIAFVIFNRIKGII